MSILPTFDLTFFTTILWDYALGTKPKVLSVTDVHTRTDGQTISGQKEGPNKLPPLETHTHTKVDIIIPV